MTNPDPCQAANASSRDKATPSIFGTPAMSDNPSSLRQPVLDNRNHLPCDTQQSTDQATPDVRNPRPSSDRRPSLGHTAPAGAAPRTTSDMVLSPGSAKIQSCHLVRQAFVYVRQSTLQQVLEHRESTARQYALVEQAVALGWPRSQVEVIDEDQGQSGQSAVARTGFQRLLTAVALNQVGIIFGLEMSRLARSNKDWHQLLEVCAVFSTLLADQDGLYDPTNYNDRLLLGLKGTLSEAELHILRGRLIEGRLNKARRGELFNHVPIGYLRLPGGTVALDPDEQVRSVVALIFDQFDRQRSLHGLLRYLVKHQIRVPVRPHSGVNRSQLEWRRPNRETLQNLLHHPIYAGFYRYGHRTVDPRKQQPGRPSTGRTVRTPEQCPVLLPDRCPAYITVERFDANQERLAANRARTTAKGAPRSGPSLLGGLVVCGRCGQRMTIGYSNGGQSLRYSCNRAFSAYAEPLCQSLAGQVLDELVGEQILQALQPQALQLSLAAVADLEQERARLHRHHHQELERATYQVERARRQYQAVEPENRLVARELERAWNEALLHQQQVQARCDQFRRAQPTGLTDEERAQIAALAEDIPALWHAATTTPAERQEVARLLLESVAVTVVGQSEQVEVRLTWKGGHVSVHALTRPVGRYALRSDYPRLLERIAELSDKSMSLAAVAEQLNQDGFVPPKRTKRFTGAMVARLLSKQGRRGPRPQAATKAGMLLEHEWFLSDLARELGMPRDTLHRWRRVGWVRARKLAVAGGPWVLWADEEELTRLRQLRQTPRGWSEEAEARTRLTQPKEQPDN
jgi:DNA invertase Pin-like site-specific DNA recombinase